MRIVLLGGWPNSLLLLRRPLIADLVAAGHEVVAVAGEPNEEVAQGLAAMGVAYEHVPIARSGLNPIGDTGTLLALTRTFRRLRPDRVLAYTIKPVVYGGIAARRCGIPFYAMITGLGYGLMQGSGLKRRAIGALVRRLYGYALADARAVVFQNPDDEAFFRAEGIIPAGRKTVLVNGSGVDLDRFQVLPPVTQPVSFLMIARLLRDKGVGEYVAAAEMLRSRFPEAVFRLAGFVDPNPTGFSECHIAEWRRRGAIEFLGKLDDVRPALARASVYVLPSYREGTPMSVLEAMATGRPIVTTDAPGCRQTVVEGENGFLVPVRDATSLADRMACFVRDPTLIVRMGAASRRIAVERFDVRSVNREIMQSLELSS